MNSRTSQSAEIQAAMNAYESLVHNQMLSAVESALNNLELAKIGWSTGENYINVNRCQKYTVELPDGIVQRCCSLGVNPTGPVDHTLFFLNAENFDGKPIAFFVNYAVHCCVMISNNSDGSGKVGISGDMAGVTSLLYPSDYVLDHDTIAGANIIYPAILSQDMAVPSLSLATWQKHRQIHSVNY